MKTSSSKYKSSYLKDCLDKPSKRSLKPKKLRKGQKQPELVAKTFDEWVEAGYRVSKGMKSRSRNMEGVPLFGPDQVWKPQGADYVPGPIVKPSNDWSKPSGLVQEVIERVEQKKLAEEAKHMFITPGFKPQKFSKKDTPPW